MKKNIYGLLFTLIIVVISSYISSFILLGSVTVAIILGIIIGNSFTIKPILNDGITYAEKTLLSFAIALMGVNLDFKISKHLGLSTILLIISGMIITIFSAIFIGRLFKIDFKLALTLGIGNGVCGSSAISATAPIIGTSKEHIGLSIAVVNLLGTFGIFLIPFIAYSLNLNNIDVGILAGNTLQAVGQVTAAGFSISEQSGIIATTVKMGRVLLLTPLVLMLIYIFTNKNNTTKSVKIGIPIFILVFIGFSILSSFDLLNRDIKHILALLSHFTLLMAMSAIGLKINFNSIKKDGKTLFLIGTIIFIIQIIYSLLFLLS